MPLWSRIRNTFRGERLNREIDEELESHLEEAVERGRDRAEAARALGAQLLLRERSRDLRVVAWLDSLRADAVFGWRQLKRRKIASAAAILSLGLAIGSCGAAFRLIDALLWRPLPVANPERLYVAGREGIDPGGNFRVSESCEYPLFRRMRAVVKDQAELIAVSYAERTDLTYGPDDEMEKAYLQYVSGWMFGAFGLRPAAGRLFTESDDLNPGAHPYAVLSEDYWQRRFGRDPGAIGRKVRIGNNLYEIAGVAPAPFTGTEPGIAVDVFVPTMMHPGVTRPDHSWFRALVQVKPGAAMEPLRARLHAVARAFHEERAAGWSGQTRQFLDRFLNQTVVLAPAASGASTTQRDYRRALIVLGVLVALVLAIACANVANLMTAQAASRAREMALRVAIGAGRARLVQMVLVEGAWLGFLAAGVGWGFAWWAAPFVAGSINPSGDAVRLYLPADPRVLGFGLALSLGVTLLFGIAPALRASAVRPASALKGGDDPYSRRRLMHALIAVQVAFCFVVHFAAGLFAATFERLANQGMGFTAERLLVLDTVARRPQPRPVWEQAIGHLSELPGVESAALSGWALLDGNGWNGFIWADGQPTEVLSYFLAVSPEWRRTMGIPLLDGRDLRPDDVFPGSALVNQAFVRQCFGGRNPIGHWFEKESGDGVTRIRFQVHGVTGDARYRNLREPITPTVYVPFFPATAQGAPPARSSGTFSVRLSPLAPPGIEGVLRREVRQARPELRVSNLRAETDMVRRHTVRERLLAALAMYFAAMALALAGVGLYGVLDYSVLQRRRELGIRLAIGAHAAHIARQVTRDAAGMVIAGAVAGLLLGMVSARYIQALLYEVKATDPAMVLLPAGTVLGAALLAALPAVVRALRIDPVKMLRAE